MKGYAPPDKLVVRDSLDDDISDDVEDDVFIRDGKNGKFSEEKGLKRPLMAPRRKNGKLKNSVPIMKKRTKCWSCCEPFCYGLAAITILIALIFLAALLLTMFPIPLQKIKIWLHRDTPTPSVANEASSLTTLMSEFVPCTQISVHKVWSKAITRLSSETPVRKSDINGDGIEDIIIGYGIDDNILYEEEELIMKCISTKTEETVICEGGILALNGATGETLWQRWTPYNIFSIYCNVDLNGDKRNDCVAAGRGGLLVAVNGQTGNLLWSLKDIVNPEIALTLNIDLYTINPVRDLDGDGVCDIVAVHVEETDTSRAGHIKLVSGANGKVIRTIPTPFREEVFVPIQIITDADGTEWLLVITGGQNTPGGLYVTRVASLMQYTNEREFTTIFQSEASGFMAPAILTDITGDEIEDIIVSSFNSTVYAFDGRSYEKLWSYTFPSSESISSIVPGHFDHDNVTDFMVKYNTGPGFPVYYYSQTTILSGKNGSSLLDAPITDSGGPSSLLGGISISQTFGGDYFLHWQTQCRGKVDAKDAYQFIPESNIIQQSRADTCQLRYNTSTVLKLFALARHVEPPGAMIFSTDDLILQLNQTNTKQMMKTKSVAALKHPKMSLKKLMNKEKPSEDGNSQMSNSVEKKRLDTEKKLERFREQDRIIKQKMPKYGKVDNVADQINKQNNQKPYIYLPFDQNDKPSYQSTKEGNPYDQDQRSQDDYDIFYNDDQLRRYPLRSQYPTNRDVRSKDDDVMDLEKIFASDELNDTVVDEAKTVKKVLTDLVVKPQYKMGADHPETLWDLEMEKEASEAIKESGTFDYPYRQVRQTISDDKNVKDRRETVAISDSLNANLLASISSTGTVLSALDKQTDSTIDFIFVLNVRESEKYPPLFLPEDLACIEDKMRAYAGYVNDELILLEKQFMKQCLENRIPDLSPPNINFESQIVITRISVTCSCGQLNSGEVCSKFNTIDNQKWTGFMGNFGNGLYL